MAEQLATLKAALRDEAEVEKLFKSVLSILELAAGRDAAVRYSSSLRNISAALYWGTCLLHARSDTIGEEMCSITHWRDSDKRIWAKLGVALTATVFPLTAVSPLPLPHSSAVGKSLLRHILRFLDLEEATVVSIFSAIRRLLGAIFFIFGGPIQAMYYIVGVRPVSTLLVVDELVCIFKHEVAASLAHCRLTLFHCHLLPKEKCIWTTSKHKKVSTSYLWLGCNDHRYHRLAAGQGSSQTKKNRQNCGGCTVP